MYVGIIGPGRLGSSLAQLLRQAGHRVVMTRDDALPTDVEVAILTVPDGAISTVSDLLAQGPIVLHCSGATDLQPLSAHRHIGSMHPLMTFPGPQVALPDLRGVVAAIDGNAAGLDAARQLAESLGMRPVHVTGDRRLYHAAAVLAGNGATILLAEAVRLLVAAGVQHDVAADMLAPLVIRSVINAPPDPIATLTGPAARGDLQVLRGHNTAMKEAGLDDIARLHQSINEHAQRAIAARKAKKS
jgi:predicted short-subunit dehydrogenase-like oxidoreductase (DUF2520 family)